MRLHAQPWRLLGALMLVTGACFSSQCNFTSSAGELRIAARRAPATVQPKVVRASDPVNNVSPEMAQAGKKYAQRYEDLFLRGTSLLAKMKKKPEIPKKFYFIGTNGNSAEEIAESVLDALAYIPAPDGTYFVHRKPGVAYPEIKYILWQTDKRLSEKSKVSAPDLYMEDDVKYREMETEVLQEFDALPDIGYPMGCIVGEGAVLSETNVEIMKKGIVVWLDADPDYTWIKTQFRPKQGGGLYMAPDMQQRPPVWAIVQGWDGDVDDVEGKMEYLKVTAEHRLLYEKIALVRLRVDIAGIAENSYWGAERILKALMQHYGFSDKDETSVEVEVIGKDLEKFLEGARLSKYLKPAMKWCDEQGAASIEDVVENIPDFMDSLDLKPLERKRLEKAAATVAAR